MEIKTNTNLLSALRSAATRKPTAEEIREQRASFIYGSMRFATPPCPARAAPGSSASRLNADRPISVIGAFLLFGFGWNRAPQMN